MSAENLAIIAGRGDLPAILAARYPDALMIHLGGGHGVRVGDIGDILYKLRMTGVTHLCLIGGLRRPHWLSLWPSWATWKLIFKYGFNFAGGDDALLKRLRRLLESEGFTVTGMRTLCPDLVMPVMGAMDDAHEYLFEARHIAAQDTGQACVFVNEDLEDREDKAGTDALIARNAGKNAILVKVAKPQQDLDLDMPVIGPTTIENAGRAGFRVVIAEAGKTLLIDRVACEALAAQYNLTLIGAV